MALAERLRDRGSWCGETHLQKATFFLQEMLGVPTAYHYRLHNYGPFSDDLRDELTEMRVDDVLVLVPQQPPYGPKLMPGDRADQLKRRFPKTLRRYRRQLDYVADVVGEKGVVELERLATAYWVRQHELAPTPDEQAQLINEFKPHVPVGAALRALETVETLEAEAPVVEAAE